MADGDTVRSGQAFGVLRGSARSILIAERVALNFMQRMSGIATATQLMVQVSEFSEVMTQIESYVAHCPLKYASTLLPVLGRCLQRSGYQGARDPKDGPRPQAGR